MPSPDVESVDITIRRGELRWWHKKRKGPACGRSQPYRKDKGDALEANVD